MTSKSWMLLTEEDIARALGYEVMGPGIREDAIDDARRIEAAVLRKWADHYYNYDNHVSRVLKEAAAEAEKASDGE